MKDDQASLYLAALVASSDDALIGKLPDGTILSWNATAERLYGYSADEAVGRNVSLIVPPEGRDELSDLLERIRRGERIQHRPVQRRRKNGATILVSLSVSPVHDVDGTIIGAAAMARGIVEDRSDSAVEAARYARSLIEMSINPLVTINPQGRITDVNMATEEATGIAREELIGTDFADCFSEPEKARAGYQRVLEEGLLSDYALVLRHVSGALTNVEYNATVYRDEAGELQAVFAAARDASEAQQARLQVARLAAIAASSQNATFSKDLQGTITSWNAAAEALYGYAATEAIGRNGTILLPPGHEGETQDLIKRMLRGDRGFGFETQRLRKDGSLLDVALALSPIRDAAGDIVALSIIGHDISERVRTERKLRESEEKFAAAFNASPDLMAITRLSDGKLLEVNEGFTRLLGYTRAEVIGTTTSERSIWADPADRATFVARLEESGRISDFETTLRRKDGPLVVCLASAGTTEVQSETCILSVFHDISERKQAEEALRGSEAQLRTLIDTLPDLVWLKDPEGVYLACNRRFESFFGAREKDIVGKTDYEFKDTILADFFRRRDQVAMAAGAPTANEEEIVFVEDGHREILETIKTPVRDREGRLVGVLGVGRDITERKQAEEALRESEGFLRGLFDNMPSGAAIYEVRGDGSRGSDYIIKDFNAASLRIEGKIRKEVVGKSLFDLRPAIDEYGLIPVLHGVWQTGEPALFPTTLYSDEHYTNWYENHVFRLPSGEVAAIYDDVTERKQAEEALRESEERHRDILEYGGVGVAYFSLDGRFLMLNRRAVRNLGGSEASEFIGQSVSELFGAEAGATYLARIREAAASPEAHEYVDYVELPGGPLWLASIHTRSLDAAGNVAGVQVYAQDITERKQAEQTAAERAHFLEELLEALPVPVFYKDNDLRYMGCNEAFPQLLGRSRDEVIGKTVFDVYPAAVAKRHDASDRAVLADPRRPQENELKIPGPSGSPRFILTHKAAFSDVSGTPAGIVGVDLDVTEIRQAGKELVASALQLRLTLKAAVTALGATTEMRDPYTAGHQRRVAELACAIAAELGWDEGRIETLRTAALLHDIGKIVVPTEILSKPGRLSDVEMRLIHQHSTAGAETVADIEFGGDIAEMIRQHHERLDGSGYPEGLNGDAILPEARILGVADVVEAMSSHRPYRAALGMGAALDEVREHAGVKYDADVVAACVHLVEEKGFEFTQ